MVSRGKAPNGLATIRKLYTPKWVQFYTNKIGRKPTDTKWRMFEPLLRERFFSLCGYCEELCKGEIDHFQPKSVFPRKVYVWKNWIYACHVCNNFKSETWIQDGYVNPCAILPGETSERFFSFDIKTGQILPNAALLASEAQRAKDTIEDLKLNAYHHLQKRVRWLEVLEQALKKSDGSAESKAAMVTVVSSPMRELCTITRAYLCENQIINVGV